MLLLIYIYFPENSLHDFPKVEVRLATIIIRKKEKKKKAKKQENKQTNQRKNKRLIKENFDENRKCGVEGIWNYLFKEH